MRLSLLFTSDNEIYKGIERFGVPRCTEPYEAYKLAMVQVKDTTEIWYIEKDVWSSIKELRRFYWQQFQLDPPIFVTNLPEKVDF